MTVGDSVAVISIDAGGAANLVWRDAKGIERPNPSKGIAGEHAETIRRLKSDLKDLRKALGVERARIEEIFVEDREWDLLTWRSRYVDHPFTGSLGRRLIWRFVDAGGASETAIPTDDRTFVTVDGSPAMTRDGTRVRLWHPINSSESEVAAWRAFVLRERVRQPFKQAFREIYRITPAEQETSVYSNRFAAHILLYGQARALMSARRWASNFLGPFDGGQSGTARREFRSVGISAEFFHDALSADADAVEHCTTDQVRFVPIGPGQPLELASVPAVVFSEAMRDVDLFIGVASVGTDRNWQDWGAGRPGRWAAIDEYFGRYFDAPLTASAAVRRDVIERILPGLVIADRCELQERWLRVRGDLRTYRIHIGSANIMMEPSDTYLCIVPARGASATGKVFLPFDDDPTLGLILSKAFLLAGDAANFAIGRSSARSAVAETSGRSGCASERSRVGRPSRGRRHC